MDKVSVYLFGETRLIGPGFASISTMPVDVFALGAGWDVQPRFAKRILRLPTQAVVVVVVDLLQTSQDDIQKR